MVGLTWDADAGVALLVQVQPALHSVFQNTRAVCRETLSHKIGKTKKQKNIDKSKVWHLNKKTGLDPLF